ncbi:MAG: FAD synthase [Nanohaloarchaea archaeon SW_7_43_1]|nr:MAG: FAD synthase [Nanohaloarchaea archaeon SW_7_43_1]
MKTVSLSLIGMKTVMAQGTFDILHPGHIHYLEESSGMGDELVVVISRDSRIKKRKDLVFSEDERKKMVEALESVDRAILGSETDIYDTVRNVNPDVITLGYDQKHDRDEVRELAEDTVGHDVEVLRIEGKNEYSSTDIKKR